MSANILRAALSNIQRWQNGKAKTLFLCLTLLSLLTLSACDDGYTDAEGLATLIVVVTSSCDGKLDSVEIYVDDALVADLAPGESTSRLVTFGRHTIEGIGNDGRRFGPAEIDIDADTFTQNLNCR